jgi:hypothetical protein
MDDMFKTVTLYFKTGIVVSTFNRLAVEDLAKEMIRSFSILPLISVKDSRFIIKEEIMSMFLKLNIEFEISYGTVEMARELSITIKRIMKNLPMIDVKYVTTDIVE